MKRIGFSISVALVFLVQGLLPCITKADPNSESLKPVLQYIQSTNTLSTLGTPTGIGDNYSSTDFFVYTPGIGIKYHVTDNGTPLDVNVWAVSQYVEAGKSTDLDFFFTLVKEGTTGQYFRNSSIGGQIEKNIDGENITCFYAGLPVGNQANFYRNFSLPATFTSGDQWDTWDNKSYLVEYVGNQTIDSTVFDECIKVSIDDSLNSNGYLRGTGYFILAREVGIVKIVFTRSDESTVLYEYLTHSPLPQNTLSGTVYFSTAPVEGILVQLANADWGTRSITDSSGNFSIDAYGPDVVLRLGYDQNNDYVFDFDCWYPEEFITNNISSNISGLVIDLQKAPLPVSETLTGIDYFNVTPGYGIKYRVTDTFTSNSVNASVWTAFQTTTPGNPLGFDFALTAMQQEAEEGTFGDGALAGYTTRNIEGKDLIWISSGNTGIHAHRLQYFSLPVLFNSGDEWMIPDLGGPQGSQTYSVDFPGTQIIGGTTFNNTIRVMIDDSQAEVDYLRGTGYFILEKDIGIVKFEFNRADGSTLRYEYLADTQLSLHSISGLVQYATSPVQGIVVDLSSIGWGAGCITDEQGNFSVQAYGPDMWLQLGYDLDYNGIFDFGIWSPEHYMVNNITGNVSGLVINLQKAPLSSELTAFRDLPEYALEDETFEVTVTFSSPADGFNAIGLSDFAPSGWTVAVDPSWCSPAPITSQATGNRADYIWDGPYTVGQEFTAVYQVTVPPGTSPGSYSFTGNIEYYIGGDGPTTVPLSGDLQVEVIEGAQISGTTYDATGTILDGVTINIDGGASVISTTNGTYQIIAATTGNHTVTASKAGFRNQVQVIEITDFDLPYTLDFKGNYGLVPDAPDISYVLACINKWIAPPGDGTELNISKVLAVINAWKFPV